MGSNVFSGLNENLQHALAAPQRATEQKQRELNLAISQNAFQQVQDEQNDANALKQFAAPLGGIAGPGAPAVAGGAPVEAPPPDPDKVAFEYYTKIAPNPAKASLVLDNVAKRAKEILERTGDPEQMLNYTNGITGRTDKFAGFKGQMIQIKNDDGTTQLLEYEPQGGAVNDKGTFGKPKDILMGEKQRLYSPSLGKVLVDGKPDEMNVPEKVVQNLKSKSGKTVTKLWYKGGRTEEIESVPSPGAMMMASAAQAQHTFSNERELNKAFLALPEVKEYPVVEKQMGRVQAAMDEARKGKVNMTAVDQTLITAFNKMLDESSVVRESEYGRTAQDLPFFNRIRGGWEKFQTGGAGLSGADREALYDMVQKFNQVAKDGYKEQESQYRELADYYFPGTGAADRVVRLGMVRPGTATEKPKAAAAASGGLGSTYTDPADGSKWVQVGKDKTKKESWRRQ